MAIEPVYPSGAFSGAARFYRKFRPRYPRALLDDLLRRLGAPEEGRLLDLGCGPGTVAVALAAHFGEVWALDLEPDMIEEGRLEAQEAGIKNIIWKAGMAENLDAPSRSFRLVTIGRAIHRMHGRIVAKKAREWLSTGGAIATLGCSEILGSTGAWQSAVAAVARGWGRGGLPATVPANPSDSDRESILRDAGFSDVGSYSFAEPRVWTVEDILGCLKSTSVCSASVLGPSQKRLEAEIRQALHEQSQEGTYHEVAVWGYTFGRAARPTG